MLSWSPTSPHLCSSGMCTQQGSSCTGVQRGFSFACKPLGSVPGTSLSLSFVLHSLPAKGKSLIWQFTAKNKHLDDTIHFAPCYAFHYFGIVGGKIQWKCQQGRQFFKHGITISKHKNRRKSTCLGFMRSIFKVALWSHCDTMDSSGDENSMGRN